jgi:site-specific recombinase XerD
MHRTVNRTSPTQGAQHARVLKTRSSSSAWIPELIAAAGPEVTETYIDFFTSTIRNRNTRAAYARACWQFFDWCGAHGLELTTVRPFHVAAWIEDFPGSKPTVKLKLAAVRMLYDFLVVRQITPSNPAHSVRGPKYVVKKGKTPVWSREDAKTLLDSIPKDSVSGLRDLALIAAMFYSFARVSAVLNSKSTITIITALAGGSDSMKKAARSMKCQCIICSSRS